MMRTSLPAIALGFAVLLTAASAQAQQVNHPTTFTGQTDLTFNGNASVTAAGNAQVTPAGGGTGSFFTTAQVPINQFTTQFVFHEIGVAGNFADGMGFCIQGIGPTAIGGGGGGMGFIGMAANSIFIKFDCYPDVSTTQIYTAGANPVDPGSIDMKPNIDIHTNRDFLVTMTYNGTVINMTVQDPSSMLTFTTSFTIDIPTVIGAGTAHVGFCGATGGQVANQEVLNWVYSSLPAPTGLVVTPGFNSNTLTWNAVAGATAYNIYRAPTAAGPFTAPPLATVNAPTVTYTDPGVTYPNTYFYVVQTVQGAVTSLNSNPPVQGTPLQPPISVNATTINTLEGAAPVLFNITINQPLTGSNTINFTITTNDATEGQVWSQGQPPAPAISAQTINFTITGPQAAGLSFPVRVYGVDDPAVDGDRPYTVTVSFTSSQPAPFSGFTIPVINCINVDNDVPGVVVSRTSGLITTESGGTDTFNVRLATSPSAGLQLNISSSNTGEGTVSTGTFIFTAANYQAGVDVIVTGVDDTLLDFTIPYTINLSFSAGGAAEYNGVVPPSVSVSNLDNEVPPTLPAVWGNAGCGLLGLEASLVLLLAALRRRGRRS